MGAEGPLLERYRALDLPMVRVVLSSFKHPSALRAGYRLVRELRRRRIQVLHSHDIYSNIFSIPFARLARTPVILASKRWHEAVPSRSHARMNAVVSRMATGVLANSEAVARSLVAEDGVAAARVTVIPNFVDEAAFAGYPAGARSELLQRLGIPADALVIGSVARLSPVKDHAMLVRAFARLAPAVPAVHLLLIGDGACRAALASQAGGLGLGTRVHFTGLLPNLPNPHGLLDISVLSSLTEGFPNAVVEAMAAGRPVVATAVGGTPEAVLPGRTGWLIPPGDDAAMAEALTRLIASPEDRRVFGAAGQSLARQRYHVDPVIHRLSEWYESLLPTG